MTTTADRAQLLITGQRYLAEMVHGYGITPRVFRADDPHARRWPRWANSGITRVTTHSEKAAAYMADGYARAVAEAWPVHGPDRRRGQSGRRSQGRLAGRLAGHGPQRRAPRRTRATATRTRSCATTSRLFAEVTKFSARVESVDRLPGPVPPGVPRRDQRRARPGPPGARGRTGLRRQRRGRVRAARRVALRAACPRSAPPPTRPTSRPRCRAAGRAERPVIVVGGGVTTSGAQAELLELAERLGIPFVTSLNGKSGHPRRPSAEHRRRRQLFALVRQQAASPRPTWCSSSAATPVAR